MLNRIALSSGRKNHSVSTATNPPHDFIDALRKLEYDKVVERISKLTCSESGRQYALRLTPQIDQKRIELELRK